MNDETTTNATEVSSPEPRPAQGVVWDWSTETLPLFSNVVGIGITNGVTSLFFGEVTTARTVTDAGGHTVLPARFVSSLRLDPATTYQLVQNMVNHWNQIADVAGARIMGADGKPKRVKFVAQPIEEGEGADE